MAGFKDEKQGYWVKSNTTWYFWGSELSHHLWYQCQKAAFLHWFETCCSTSDPTFWWCAWNSRRWPKALAPCTHSHGRAGCNFWYLAQPGPSDHLRELTSRSKTELSSPHPPSFCNYLSNKTHKSRNIKKKEKENTMEFRWRMIKHQMLSTRQERTENRQGS